MLSCALTVECFPPGENHVLVYGPVDWGRSCMGYLRRHLKMPFWGLLPLPLTTPPEKTRNRLLLPQSERSHLKFPTRIQSGTFSQHKSPPPLATGEFNRMHQVPATVLFAGHLAIPSSTISPIHFTLRSTSKGPLCGTCSGASACASDHPEKGKSYVLKLFLSLSGEVNFRTPRRMNKWGRP